MRFVPGRAYNGTGFEDRLGESLSTRPPSSSVQNAVVQRGASRREIADPPTGTGSSKYPEPWRDWIEGNNFTKNHDKALAETMIQLAAKLRARVMGEECEIYAGAAELPKSLRGDSLPRRPTISAQTLAQRKWLGHVARHPEQAHDRGSPSPHKSVASDSCRSAAPGRRPTRSRALRSRATARSCSWARLPARGAFSWAHLGSWRRSRWAAIRPLDRYPARPVLHFQYSFQSGTGFLSSRIHSSSSRRRPPSIQSSSSTRLDSHTGSSTSAEKPLPSRVILTSSDTRNKGAPKVYSNGTMESMLPSIRTVKMYLPPINTEELHSNL